MIILSKYQGSSQHGYWWLHASGALRFKRSIGELTPEVFFNSWMCIDWWHVQCELDYYRMLREYAILVNGPIEDEGA